MWRACGLPASAVGVPGMCLELAPRLQGQADQQACLLGVCWRYMASFRSLATVWLTLVGHCVGHGGGGGATYAARAVGGSTTADLGGLKDMCHHVTTAISHALSDVAVGSGV